jgi:1-acyl-sn-glycerol-3-phosphate acyltransferase
MITQNTKKYILKKYIFKIFKKYLIFSILKILLIVIFITLKKKKSIEYKNKFYNLFIYLLIKKKYIVLNKQLIRKNKSKKGIIIISNHVNIYDFIIIRNTIDCYIVANDKYIITNKIKENLEIIPYKILDKKSGNDVKKNILKLINSGKNVLVFPEGRMCNSLKNNLLKFKEGLFHLAYDNNIPILMSMLYSNNNNFAVGHPIISLRVIINILSNIFLFNNNTVIIYELIDFVYKKNFNNFNDYYEYIYNTMNSNLKKYSE